jgi:type I restriction enzyme M protein
MNATTDIVAKLWSLCDVLRDDGITYLQYVTELTYLLFLKMMQETEKEAILPEAYRWDNLVKKEGIEQLIFYRELLLKLGSESANSRVQTIFANAQTALKQPRIIAKLVTTIDSLDWYSAKEEGLGDLYEGLST